jgi:prevent-host-death family protein
VSVAAGRLRDGQGAAAQEDWSDRGRAINQRLHPSGLLSRLSRHKEEPPMDWQVAEAKNRFSEVINRALTDGPQRIHRRGQVVVMISESEYQRLSGQQQTLLEFLLAGPDLSDVNLDRDPTPMRTVE